MTAQITIKDKPGTDELIVAPERMKCSVKKDKDVRWTSQDLVDWRVIFGPHAPLEPTVVASPAEDTLTLRSRRHEDLGHVKYVVVGLTKDGKLKHVDPELIIDE